MRALWNTYNGSAALVGVAIAALASIYVSSGYLVGYRYSAWWSAALHGPMFAVGLYVYLAVAFNTARAARSWKKVLGLVAWLLHGVLVPYSVGYGLVLLLTVLGLVIPELTYLPLGLGTFEVAVHITWLGFLSALVGSGFLVVQRLRGRVYERERADA